MEIELTRIDFEADVYDVRKAVAAVLHGPDLYDPNDGENRGRVPNFEIVMGKSPAGRIHNGKAVLRVGSKLGRQLIKWNQESEDNNIVVKGNRLKVFDLFKAVPLDVKQTLEKGLYIDPEQDRQRSQIEEQTRLVRSRISKVQFGIWYKPSDSRGQKRAFSVEYERNFTSNSPAYIHVVHEHKLIHIDVSATLLSNLQTYLTSSHTEIGKRETEEIIYTICVKFSSIRKMGIGYDEFGQGCEYPWHQRFA
jgi:RNA-dependent RNA polymerase